MDGRCAIFTCFINCKMNEFASNSLALMFYRYKKIVYDAAMLPLQRSLLVTPTNRITYTIDV